MDIKDILENNNIEYRNNGRDYITKCLNPEHDDSNPSLRIDKITGIFGCFSCGFSGDLYTYFGIRNINYLDAKVLRLNNLINELIWSKPLQIPLDAEYYKSDFRGISKETYIKFRAFTTDSKEMEMDGRIIIPITDISGNIKSFNGRYLYSDLEPRYKFYPSNNKVPIFPAIPEIIEKSIILVEGIFDFLNLYDKGLTNAVCTFGTSFGAVKNQNKKKINIERLLQYRYQGVDTIYIMYDGDISGRSAASNLKEYISDKFNVEILELPDDRDPGSLSKEEVTTWREMLYE